MRPEGILISGNKHNFPYKGIQADRISYFIPEIPQTYIQKQNIGLIR
jgi:hypothetical protein